MEDLRAIKEMRRRLGITQHALAKAAGVSQSLVAKIEAGSIDPAYSKASRIIDSLRSMRHSSEKKAKDVMHEGVATVSCDETLHFAASLMRKKGISQLPVADGKKIIGSISEQTMLEQFSAGKSLARCRVCEAMGEAFPTILPDAPISSIAPLLQHYPAVLVLRRGEVAGIITKADLLKSI